VFLMGSLPEIEPFAGAGGAGIGPQGVRRQRDLDDDEDDLIPAPQIQPLRNTVPVPAPISKPAPAAPAVVTPFNFGPSIADAEMATGLILTDLNLFLSALSASASTADSAAAGGGGGGGGSGEYEAGQVLDVLDATPGHVKWLVAQVKSVDKTARTVFIHYDGRPAAVSVRLVHHAEC
jgi:hypothetical protein